MYAVGHGTVSERQHKGRHVTVTGSLHTVGP